RSPPQHHAAPGPCQRARGHGNRPGPDHVSPSCGEERIICPVVHDAPFGSERIPLPLLLDIDQRPLPPAEYEVLNAGELQPVFGMIFAHNISMNSTPAGRSSRLTLTV